MVRQAGKCESDSEFAKLLKKIELPHKELHQHGKSIDAKLASSNISEARGIYQDSVLPVLTTVREYLHEMEERARKNLAGKTEAEAIFASETQMDLKEVQNILKQMIKMATENIMSEDEMISAARSTRTMIIIISILAFIIGRILAFFITRSITRPVKKTVQMIEDLGKGHLGNRLNLDSKDEIGQMARQRTPLPTACRMRLSVPYRNWPITISATKSIQRMSGMSCAVP